jgi:hypothetical protein
VVARLERPNYCFGDLLRGYIRRCLGEDEPEPARRKREASRDPKEMHVHQLRALARRARRIAKEIEAANRTPPSPTAIAVQ